MVERKSAAFRACVKLRRTAAFSRNDAVEPHAKAAKAHHGAGETSMWRVPKLITVWRSAEILEPRMNPNERESLPVGKVLNKLRDDVRTPEIPLTQFPCHSLPRLFDKRFGQRNGDHLHLFRA
jgi:hypothetical protein